MDYSPTSILDVTVQKLAADRTSFRSSVQTNILFHQDHCIRYIQPISDATDHDNRRDSLALEQTIDPVQESSDTSPCSTFWMSQIFPRLLRASSTPLLPRQPQLSLTWYPRLRHASLLSKPLSMVSAVRLECTRVTFSRLQLILRWSDLQFLRGKDLDPSTSVSSSCHSPKLSVLRSRRSGRTQQTKQLQTWPTLPALLCESCSQLGAWRPANHCRGATQPLLRQDPRHCEGICSNQRLN
jgi:hypothetical protein